MLRLERANSITKRSHGKISFSVMFFIILEDYLNLF